MAASPTTHRVYRQDAEINIQLLRPVPLNSQQQQGFSIKGHALPHLLQDLSMIHSIFQCVTILLHSPILPALWTTVCGNPMHLGWPIGRTLCKDLIIQPGSDTVLLVIRTTMPTTIMHMNHLKSYRGPFITGHSDQAPTWDLTRVLHKYWFPLQSTVLTY
jgi:hypothetical protein